MVLKMATILDTTSKGASGARDGGTAVCPTQRSSSPSAARACAATAGPLYWAVTRSVSVRKNPCLDVVNLFPQCLGVNNCGVSKVSLTLFFRVRMSLPLSLRVQTYVINFIPQSLNVTNINVFNALTSLPLFLRV